MRFARSMLKTDVPAARSASLVIPLCSSTFIARPHESLQSVRDHARIALAGGHVMLTRCAAPGNADTNGSTWRCASPRPHEEPMRGARRADRMRRRGAQDRAGSGAPSGRDGGEHCSSPERRGAQRPVVRSSCAATCPIRAPEGTRAQRGRAFGPGGGHLASATRRSPSAGRVEPDVAMSAPALPSMHMQRFHQRRSP